MACEQGAGGGNKSNRRQSSTSTAENGQIQDTKKQNQNIKPPQQQPEEAQYQQPQHGEPRNFNSTAPNAPASAAPMSRNPSAGSNVVTPNLQAKGNYFDARHGIGSGNGRQHQQQQQPSLPREPPVTKATLSELDVSKIIHNPKLRHDINFDPELHFRPNVDGDKGRNKELKAQHFWNSLQEQLTMFTVDQESFYRIYGTNDGWCLPQLLKTVKDIIQTLVPVRDRVHLDEGLNVELLMQQFNKGIADLEKLASWLARVLKSHCAPMRDEWVDKMYEKLSHGNRNNDIGELVQGMRGLLEVLEAMKLDVANNQIRCLKPVLIEDTVHFEQRFFLKRIQQRSIDVGPTRHWYQDAEQRYAGTGSPAAHQAFGDMAVFFEAFLRLVRPSLYQKQVPHTFIFDEERLLKLRSDMLNAVNLEICMRLYEDLERVSRSVNSFLANGFPSSAKGSALADDEPAPSISRTSSPFTFDFNARPSSGSRPSSLAFSYPESATSSPSSSLVFSSQPQHSTPSVGPATDSTEAKAKAKARTLYNSLVALLQSSPPPSRYESRWVSLAPAMALQIFRYTNAPSNMLPNFEAKLLDHVTNMHGSLLREVEDQYHARLLNELQRRVREFRGLSGVALFSDAMGGRRQDPGRVERHRDEQRDGADWGREAREEGGLEDMATRMAHLGVLHWRVWSPLAYVGDRSSLQRDMSAPAPRN